MRWLSNSDTRVNTFRRHQLGHIFAAVGENEFIISLLKLKLIAEVFLCACMKQ